MEIENAAPLTITSDTAPETEAPEVNDDGPIEGEKLDIAPAKTEEVSTEPKETAKVKLTANEQIVVDKIRNKEVFKRHETERELQAANEKLAKIEADKPKAVAPEVPARPNPEDFIDDDEGLKAAEAARDNALVERARFDDTEKRETADRENQAVQNEQEFQKRIHDQAGVYLKRAQDFGIDDKSMVGDVQLLNQAGVSNELRSHIAQDDKGPLITKYLVGNPTVLETVMKMSPIEAGIYINTNVKSNLASAVQTTNAPAPAEVINGGGTPEQEDPALLGAEWK